MRSGTTSGDDSDRRRSGKRIGRSPSAGGLMGAAGERLLDLQGGPLEYVATVGNGNVRFRGSPQTRSASAEQLLDGRWQTMRGVAVDWYYPSALDENRNGVFKVNYSQLWKAYDGDIPASLRTVAIGQGRTAFNYTFDRSSRVISASTRSLVLKSGQRNYYAQAVAGGRDRISGVDDGGHIFGAQFGGPTNSFNHFAQNSQINQNGGQFYNLEADWVSNLRQGRNVGVSMDFSYSGNSLRPNSYTVTTKVDGRFEQAPVTLSNPTVLAPKIRKT